MSDVPERPGDGPGEAGPTDGAGPDGPTPDGPTPDGPTPDGPGPGGADGAGPAGVDEDDDEDAPDGGAADDDSGCLRLLLDSVLVVAVALVLSVLIRTFLVQAFYVPSESMENTLVRNDRMLVSRVTTKLTGVHRGEVVVFVDPGGWLGAPEPETGVSGAVRTFFEWVGVLPTSGGQDLVKRVVAVGGDRLRCCDARDRLVLNGVPLDEPYTAPGGTAQVRFDVQVPEGSVFVMGDNRGNSRDSRYHLETNNGAVPVDNVVGRVVLVVWPLDRWSTVPIPDAFGNPALGTP